MTTRRRKFWVLKSLRRGLGPLTARALGLGMPGFDVGVLAMSGLPPRRLPASDFPLALRLLAVALVPTPRLVLAAASFAEANPRARLAPTGRTAVLSGTRGRHNSRVTDRHLSQSSRDRAFILSSKRPEGVKCSQMSGVRALRSLAPSFCDQCGRASTLWSMSVLM